MYAIIRAGGKQYKVAENDIIDVNKLAVSAGDEIVLDEVLLVSDDSGTRIGTPYVTGAKVIAKALRQYKGRKVRGFTYKPKKHTQRHYGHRQQLTAVAIEKISLA